ncbi:penicillin-binding protein 2 [Candidatus Jorgensenbacteria bacterium]|nr:penicillin-binding protein 2 [Candidatus Jorgensenbacteria bacterium]
MAFRFIALTLLFSALFGVLGFNLYQLQVEKGAYYFERAKARSIALNELELRRGEISFTDRHDNNIPVAQNRDYPIIYAAPKELKEPRVTARMLAPEIGKGEAELIEIFEKNPASLYKLLVDKAPPEALAAVRRLKLSGIYTDERQDRFYPNESMAAQVIGFVGVNQEHDKPTGLAGVEKFYEDALSSGEDTNLTIDRNIQGRAEQILSELIAEFDGTGGTVIVQEPKTGKIMALANSPSFNPNEYGKSSVKFFDNPAVQYVYEPGSVFKPLTMASGIDSGAITPETTFFDNGSVTLNGKTIRNWDNKAHGKVTMTNVIEQSINTGAVFAEQKIGHGIFLDYLKHFGFGEKTSVDLPDEVRGSLKNLENKNARAIDFATASYGQGTSVTPIQLITAFSSIGNGGVLMRPYINADLKPHVVRRVVQEETASKVTEMMESAVRKARIASISGYRIAGKTGTAFIPDFEKGGYTDQLIHTYVGFAPASDPVFTILIKLERPAHAELAGMTVVPAFRGLAQFVLSHYNIAPDMLQSPETVLKPKP